MENLEWAVGRRKKFGEESGFVSVRVPKSKVSEYRDAIKKLVDDKFSRESYEVRKEDEDTVPYEKETVVFRDFREFGNTKEEKEVSEAGYPNEFVAGVFEEVDRLGQKEKKLGKRR